MRQGSSGSEEASYLEAQDHTRWRSIGEEGLNKHMMVP